MRVRPLQVPDATKLETLPDSFLFILRAVLQLAPATVHDVAQATCLSGEQVRYAFQFGEAQGFLTQAQGGAYLNWHWLRPIILHLSRRRLLVSP
jgi:hypothetical protein